MLSDKFIDLFNI